MPGKQMAIDADLGAGLIDEETARKRRTELEGESAFSQSFTVNPNGLFDTPFDEVIDVSSLASGIYYLRLYIEGTAGGESLVKPFAVRR